MRAFGATLRRELGAYFVSPIAYVVLFFFLLLTGAWFWYTAEMTADQEVPYSWDQVFGMLFFLTSIIMPFLTMRLLAEEKNRGTIEMLVTAPVREWVVVVSKYTAAMVFWGFLLVWTVAYPALMARYSTVDWGQVASGYAGILLTGMAMCSIGLFISGMVSHQITAGVITFVVLFAPAMGQTLAGIVTQGMEDNRAARILTIAFMEVDWRTHVTPFLQGIVDLRHVAFYGGISVFFLFITILGLESRRWR